MARSTELSSGAGRTLVFVYGVFAASATARSTFQLATDAERAPLAYGLSFLAAVVYVVATVSLLRGGARAWRLAVVACTVELVGVLGVGVLSLVRADLFPEPTVWSELGQGYGYVPLVLPVLGLLWLRRTRSIAEDACAEQEGE